eukprot:3799900-Rhodomonas_salina.1
MAVEFWEPLRDSVLRWCNVAARGTETSYGAGSSEHASRCPILAWGMLVHLCYGVPGIEIGYAL